MAQYDSLIFSAAGAFVSLPRPGREDAERLDALAMPLFDKLSVEGKRRISAVLSECRSIIPEKLVEALVLEPLDISASLLISRAEIPDFILEKAIESGGEPHARVIALNQTISLSVKTRIDALIESIVPMTQVAVAPLAPNFETAADTSMKSPAQTQLEIAQDRLRNMMMRKTIPETQQALMKPLTAFAKGAEPNIVARFINLALEGDADFLCTALADEWTVPFPALRPLVQRNSLHSLAVLLKGLDFGATDTFAIAAAFNPQAFGSREAIASFYLKFQAIADQEIDNLRQRLEQTNAPQNPQKGEAA